MPVTPARIWQAIQEAKRKQPAKAASAGSDRMSQATEILGARVAPHARVVGAVSAAHFVSHYYILLLAPLLPFVRADYGVSYTELGLALAAFNVVSAALQTPAGFLVDRLGARILLIGGAADRRRRLRDCGRSSHSFWVFVAMFALAGVGNTVYHPADYALLSHHVPSERIGQAFSVHTFAGMLGSAVAPRDAAADAERLGLARRLRRRRPRSALRSRRLLLAVRDRSARPRMRSRRAPARQAGDGRLAAAAVAADPAQPRLLRAARDDERRHLQLFGGRARRALCERR